jgi:hypothetical protein
MARVPRARALLLCVSLVLVPAAADAQTLPFANLFAGYGYLAFNSGETFHSFGPEAEFNINLTPRVGVFYGFGLHWPTDVDAAVYENVGGVRAFVPTPNGKGRFFAHGMIGSAEIDEYYFYSSWLIGGGVGYDLQVGEKVDIRVFKADYLMTFFFEETQTNFRVSAGVSFRLGKR